MLLVLTCSLAASAQQSIVSKRLDAFRNIDLSGNLHVELIKADSAHIDVKLNGTNSNRLDWGIKNGTLSVHLRPGGEKGASGDVKIYYDTLSSLKISASNVSVQGTLTQGMIDVDMTAGAIFGADLQLKDICLKITGNSVANLTGSAKYGTLIATSKGECPSAHVSGCTCRGYFRRRGVCQGRRTYPDRCEHRRGRLLSGRARDFPQCDENDGYGQQHR